VSCASLRGQQDDVAARDHVARALVELALAAISSELWRPSAPKKSMRTVRAVTRSRALNVAACRANSVHSVLPESVSVMVKSSTSLSGSRSELPEAESFLPLLQPGGVRPRQTRPTAAARRVQGLGAARPWWHPEEGVRQRLRRPR